MLKTDRMTRATRDALRITLIYVVVSVFWITFSDFATRTLFSAALAGQIQTYKGIFFVLVTGVLLLTLIRRSLTRVHASRSAQAESQHRWSKLVEHTSDAVIILDGDRIVFANSAAANLFGAQNASVPVGRTIDTYLMADDAKVVAQRLREVVQGNPVPSSQYRFRRIDGGERIVEMHSTAIKLYDDSVVLSILIDVTERVEQQRLLQFAKEEAERLSEVKAAILANMSHEIRTPLTGIIGLAEVIGDHAEGEARELAMLLKHSSWRLVRTLESILTLAQLEAGAVQISRNMVDVAMAAQSSARLFGPQAEGKGLRLEIDLPEEPIFAALDTAALDQIVMNLVSNAVKFTLHGVVAVRVHSENASACIEVKDTGVGISESFLPHIFEEYQQESSGLSRDFEGVGLGLTIVKRLTDMMDGEIAVESRKHVGSRFLVRLPLAGDRANDGASFPGGNHAEETQGYDVNVSR